jgi:8-oxo-dGTP pyrophosphatase MutT (NUDIX family)
VLLVTSRATKRWLLPKGWPVKGKSTAESALQEAFEEAGVWGNAGEQPIGSYLYDKVLDDGTALPCKVDVFAIRTGGLLAQWPEMSERRRRWYSAAAAAAQVAEPDLAQLLRGCESLVQAA